jgi:hypothetical protein
LRYVSRGLLAAAISGANETNAVSGDGDGRDDSATLKNAMPAAYTDLAAGEPISQCRASHKLYYVN